MKVRKWVIKKGNEYFAFGHWTENISEAALFDRNGCTINGEESIEVEVDIREANQVQNNVSVQNNEKQ